MYRATDKEGPFKRISEKPIEGAGTSDVPHRYLFVDWQIDPTLTYYYYVESISLAGQRKRMSPIARVAAKIKPR